MYKFCIFITLTLLVLSCHTDKIDLEMITTIDQNWKFRQADQEQWFPAKVPGTVHANLLQNGLIEDPFYRLNEHDLQWVDKKDWEYRTNLKVESDQLNSDRIEAVFKGLDTHADVYINNEKILVTDNMFREWKADVKHLLKVGDNELRIFFHSPIKIGVQKYDSLNYKIPVSQNDLAEIGGLGEKKVSVHLRKAGYHFGWDWGPRLVTSGIWQPVILKLWNLATITNVQVIQKNLSGKSATLKIPVEIEAVKEGEVSLSVVVDGVKLYNNNLTLKKGVHLYPVEVTLENPELWYPNGAGEQKLYNVEVQLRHENKTFSRSQTRIGLRTVEVVQEADTVGRSFYLKVNDRPMFMKGVNYIPQDVFLDRVSRDQYKYLIESAAKANMNMIRVWGGGIYEKDIFYELCDEYGILVWQDFMFACSMYPGDEAFLENVKKEAVYQVKRLRNHPSLALWCGNNESLVAWYNWGWKQNAIDKQGQEIADKIWNDYETIFHKILLEAVKEHDPDKFYWSSSPQAETGVPENYTSGDVHYWGVWWGQEDFENYKTKIPRFMSEYGFQSFPELKTVKKFAEEEDWDIYSEVMKSHQRSNIGNGTIENYMLRHYKKPVDFPMFLYVGQLLQAEGIKTAIEAHRTNMPYCMGSLYWQLNDCWPVASWSSIDYYGEWKAVQYFVSKAFENLLVSPTLVEDSLNVYIVSDLTEDRSVDMQLTLIDFENNVIWRKDNKVRIRNNTSQVHFSTGIKDFPIPDTSRVLLHAVLTDPETQEVITSNILYFTEVKNLNLPKPNISVAVSTNDAGYSIKLQTDRLAKNVYISTEEVEGFFSDNYFDLLPGISKEITFDTQAHLEHDDNIFKVVTLVDSFK